MGFLYGVLNQSPTPQQRLFDVFTTGTVGYSLSNKLRTNYQGPAFRVFTNSKPAGRDIFYAADGRVDESAIAQFCAGEDGFILILYDNGYKGFHAFRETYYSGVLKVFDAVDGILRDDRGNVAAMVEPLGERAVYNSLDFLEDILYVEEFWVFQIFKKELLDREAFASFAFFTENASTTTSVFASMLGQTSRLEDETFQMPIQLEDSSVFTLGSSSDPFEGQTKTLSIRRARAGSAVWSDGVQVALDLAFPLDYTDGSDASPAATGITTTPKADRPIAGLYFETNLPSSRIGAMVAFLGRDMSSERVAIERLLNGTRSLAILSDREALKHHLLAYPESLLLLHPDSIQTGGAGEIAGWRDLSPNLLNFVPFSDNSVMSTYADPSSGELGIWFDDADYLKAERLLLPNKGAAMTIFVVYTPFEKTNSSFLIDVGNNADYQICVGRRTGFDDFAVNGPTRYNGGTPDQFETRVRSNRKATGVQIAAGVFDTVNRERRAYILDPTQPQGLAVETSVEQVPALTSAYIYHTNPNPVGQTTIGGQAKNVVRATDPPYYVGRFSDAAAHLIYACGVALSIDQIAESFRLLSRNFKVLL